MTDRAQYQEHLAEQLSAWEKSIEKLRARGQHANVDARIGYENEVARLEASHRAARKTLAAMRAASADVWPDMRVASERAWAEMGKAMEDAAVRFR